MSDSPCTHQELVSLRDHFERMLEEHEKRDLLMHAANDKAQDLLAHQAQLWREQANEWRSAMDDRERQFLPRSLGYVVAIVSIVSLILGMWTKLG